tara:strand:- start:34 stop:297 length:264 start_codon:yes stop_codon:yes gene_type:complete
MRQKSILLNARSNSSEIDLILAVFYELKKKIEKILIGIFQSKNKQILNKIIKKYLNGGLDNNLNLKFERYKKDYSYLIKMSEISKFF